MKKYLITILLLVSAMAINAYATEDASSTAETTDLKNPIIFTNLNCSGLLEGGTLSSDKQTAVDCVNSNNLKSVEAGTQTLEIASSTPLGQIEKTSVPIPTEGTTTSENVLKNNLETQVAATTLNLGAASSTSIIATSSDLITATSSTTIIATFLTSTASNELAISGAGDSALSIEGGKTLITVSSTTASSTLNIGIDVAPKGLDIVGGEKANDPLFVFFRDSNVVYGDENYEVDKEKVVVGNKSSEKGKFNPEVKFERFEGETDLRIWTEEKGDKDAVREGIKTKWKTDKGEKTYAFYKLTPEQVGNQEGGFEYEITLNEKPDTNIVTLKIKSEDLDYNYQPPLDKEDFSKDPRIKSCTPTECLDSGGKRARFRPENVVGSYAVYHKTKIGDYSNVGGKNYKAGKAFHIYRPKIVDNSGKWVWGELNIDATLGNLTITITQEFLDKALYPVIVDPTVGYTTLGATADATGDFILAEDFIAPQPGEALPGTFFFGGQCALVCTTIIVMGGAYAGGGADPTNRAKVDSVPAKMTMNSLTAQFWSAPITWSSISPITYWISINNATDGNSMYDAGGGTIYATQRVHSNDMPNTWPSVIDSTVSGRLSVYVQYTSDRNPSSLWWNFIQKITPMVFARERR